LVSHRNTADHLTRHWLTSETLQPCAEMSFSDIF
jgi:hypothetical protein